MFASTRRLNLRPFMELDGEHMMALQYDREVQKTANADYIAPRSQAKTLQDGFTWLETGLLSLIVEVKQSEAGFEESTTESDRWVGFVRLEERGKGNQEVTLGISFKSQWWDKGFGTEVLCWTIEYAFKNLNMHRVSLSVIGNNDRALNVYRRM